MNFSEFLSQCNSNEKTSTEFIDSAFEQALNTYFKTYRDCKLLSERICLGEYIENAEVVFKGLYDAYNSYVQIKKEKYGKEPIPINSINIEQKAEVLSMEGNRLLGEGLKEQDINKIEAGKWLLFCSM